MDEYLPAAKIPEWIEVNYSKGKRWVLKCVVEGKDYEVCEDPKMWSSGKPGEYGKGIANTTDDPLKVERTGKLGEVALSQIIQLPVDFAFKENGDNYDFIMDGFTVDIKTATRLPNYEASLMQAVNSYKRAIPLKCDYYVASYISVDDRANKRAEVIIVGVIDKNTIQRLPKVPAKKGEHLNYELNYNDPNISSEKIRNMVDLIIKKKLV